MASGFTLSSACQRPLYREIRIENPSEDEKGKKVKLKEGTQVEVTVEVDPNDTAPKTSNYAM
jgi:hypothetical protein